MGLRENSYHTPFKCIGPILTTWRIFSLLRIPSRRPRVIPATLSSLVPLIIWLSVCCFISECEPNPLEYGESLTFSSGDADTLRFHLVAETTLIFPQCGRDSRFGSWRCDLSSGIIDVSLKRRSSRVCIALGRNRMVCYYSQS